MVRVSRYRFLRDEKWYEDIAHILVGLVPLWGWLREHVQWPPGDTWVRTIYPEGVYTRDPPERRAYAPLDRVADAYRDFLGYAIGDALRTVGLVLVAILT